MIYLLKMLTIFSFIMFLAHISGSESASVWLSSTTSYIFPLSDHTLTCHFSDKLPFSTPVTFQWYRNNEVITNNSGRYTTRQNSMNEGDLIITDFNEDLNGDFNCIVEVTSTPYRLISEIITLQVIKFNAIPSATSPEIVLQGGEFNALTCPVHLITSIPAPRITWAKSSLGDINDLPNVGITLSRERVLILVASSPASGRYSCEVANTLLNTSHVYQVGTVLILSESVTPVRIFQVTPQDVNATINGDANFECFLSGSTLSPPVRWFFNNSKLTEIEGSIKFSQNKGILTILNATHQQAGEYSCFDAQNLTSFHSARLRIYSRPILSDMKSLELPIESNFTFSCSLLVDPHNAVKYTLLHNGEILSSKISIKSSSITIPSINNSSAGVYQCYTHNFAGSDNIATILTINANRAPAFLRTPSDLLVFSGDNFSVDCSASGTPTPQYNITSPLNTIYPLGTSSSLNIYNATHSHSGQYRCSVYNTVGIISHYITVIIIERLQTSDLPISNITAVLYNSVTLLCNVTEDINFEFTLELSYHWRIYNSNATNTFNMMSSGDLEITQVTSHNEGTYLCYARVKATALNGAPYIEWLIEKYRLAVDTTLLTPNSLSATSINATLLFLTWYPPSDANSADTLYYHVESLVSSEWVGLANTSLTSILITVCPSSTYQYRVVAYNQVGRRGEPTPATDTITTDFIAPTAAPENVTVDTIPSQNVEIKWTLPHFSGECSASLSQLITHYVINIKNTHSQVVTEFSGISHNQASSTNDSLLPADYVLKVAFSNFKGIGPFSPLIAFSIDITLGNEDTPTYLEAAPYGFGTLAVFFDADPTSHTKPIDGYHIFYQELLEDGNITEEVVTYVVSNLTELILIPNLTYNSWYRVSVAPYNSYGVGPRTLPITVLTQNYAVLLPVTQLNATFTTDTTLFLQWQSPVTSTQSISHYNILLSFTYPNYEPNTIQHITKIVTNSFTSIIGLEYGLDYAILLHAVDSNGIAGFNATRSFQIALGPPTAPKLKIIGSLLKWIIKHNGGDDLKEITIEILNGTIWEFSETLSYNATNYTLATTVAISLRIVIKNDFGSAVSNSVDYDPNMEAADKPMIIIIISVILSSVFLFLLLCCIPIASIVAIATHIHNKTKKYTANSNSQELEKDNKELSVFMNSFSNDVASKQQKDKFPTIPLKTSSDSNISDIFPPSYHSREQSKQSKTSATNSDSHSSGSIKQHHHPNKVVINIKERQNDPPKAVLHQSTLQDQAKFIPRTVMFRDHSTISSVETQSSIPCSAAKSAILNKYNHVMPSGSASPPLTPTVFNNTLLKQPHQLNLSTNQYQNSSFRNSLEVDDTQLPFHNPAVIHTRSRSDELSDHYMTMQEVQSPTKQSQTKPVSKNNSKRKLRTQSQEKLTSFANLFKTSSQRTGSKKDESYLVNLPPLPACKDQTLVGTIFSDKSGYLRGPSPSPLEVMHFYSDSYQSYTHNSIDDS